MAASPELQLPSSTETWRQRAMLGELPPDFLRILITPQQAQCAQDAHTARMLQYQQNAQAQFQAQQRLPHPAVQAQYPAVIPGAANGQTPMSGRLNLTIVEARLTKNYGMTRMDPYCRLRIGHAVFETPTSYNGAKNPRWNKTVQCYLPQNVDMIHLEIYDERAFSVDDRIAWCDIQLPAAMIEGQDNSTVDDWFVLSGKQGEEREGSINVVYSFIKGSQPMMQWAPGLQPMVMMQNPSQLPPVIPPPNTMATVIPPQQEQQQQQQQQLPSATPKPPSPEDVALVKEMFPEADEEVVKSVLEANDNDKEAAINALLSME